MSLRHMLHVNATRMCDPKRPEAAKFPSILSFPCTLTHGAHPLLRLACYQDSLRLLLFSPSCFLSITPPSYIPTSFLSFLLPLSSFLSFLPLPFLSFPSPCLLPSSSSLPFRLQLGAVQTRMQSKGGYSNGSDVPDTATPTGTFVVRTRKQ